MALTPVQKFILYTLGSWYEASNKRLGEKPFHVAFSKSAFIDLVRTAQIVEKQERALYKNLEDLERKRLIAYANRNLVLTVRGEKHFGKIRGELEPYMQVAFFLTDKDPLRYARKIQTVLAMGRDLKYEEKK